MTSRSMDVARSQDGQGPTPSDAGFASSIERPLHVRVAEALGWTRLSIHHYNVSRENEPTETWAGYPPSEGEMTTVYRYDTDWSATGPLIERLAEADLMVSMGFSPSLGEWWASPVGNEDGPDECEWADAPLIAVCNLILALHEAGKLPK